MALALVLTSAAPARAESLHDLVADLLKSNKLIQAAEMDRKAAREKVDVARGDWFPKFDATADYGRERQRKGDGRTDTSLIFNELDLKLTQLVWDFGTANAGIDKAQLSYLQTEYVLQTVTQLVLLDAITAHIGVIKAQQVVEYAKGSEANIKRQTELEDARVQRGGGFSTDVLQAKAQLAGAQAKRIQAEGALHLARNHYYNVFGKFPELIPVDEKPRLPLDMMPKEMEETVELAVKENPELKATRTAVEVARKSIDETRSKELAPTLNAIAEQKWKDNVSGQVSNQQDSSIKLQLKYSINAFLTQINTLRASELGAASAEARYHDAKDKIEEKVRNAWRKLETDQANSEALRTQSDISSEFLELARKERQLGRRSLIDLLSSETALINANSDAAAAEADVLISAFTVLQTMGRLNLDMLK